MKVILQDGIKDCGICCLLSIIKHYKGNCSKEYLRQLTNTTKNGVTAYNLVTAAESLGFSASAMKGELENLREDNLPCISHVIINKSYQHFVVIYNIDIKLNKILIMDPAKGKRLISTSEFKLMSSNNYIFLRPNKKLPNLVKNEKIKETITNFFNEHRRLFLTILYLNLSYFVFHILSAFHFKYLLNFSIEYRVSNNIMIISLIIGIIYILKETSTVLRNILITKYSELLDYKITLKTYEQIILLPYLYYKNRTTGEIISRIKDLSYVKGYIVKLFTVCSTDIFTSFIFMILLFNINKILTLCSIILFILLITLNLLQKPKLQSRIKKYYRKEEKLNSYLIEVLSCMDVIKGMHTEKLVIDKLKIKYQNFLESIYKLSLVQELFTYFSNNINDLFQVIILGLGSYEVVKTNLSLGQLIIYQSILSFLNTSISNIVNLFHDYPNYILAKERVEDLFNIKKEKFVISDYHLSYPLKRIRYTNLSYSYNSKQLLRNINLEICSKDKVLLLGPSGCGKSTLVKLLMRYLEIPFGMISINNMDINHYNLDNLRSNITYISQQEFLFSDTLYNNITLGKDYSKEEVEKVIELTLVNELVDNNSLSYDQLVEENGLNFSGGERQRIILARSILKKSDVYIFDEALSQVDIEKERKILKNIFRYLKDKIIIVISHRYDNNDLFNRVIRLKDGALHEEKL